MHHFRHNSASIPLQYTTFAPPGAHPLQDRRQESWPSLYKDPGSSAVQPHAADLYKLHQAAVAKDFEPAQFAELIQKIETC